MGEPVQIMRDLKQRLGDEKYAGAEKIILRVIKQIIENPDDEKKRSLKLDKFKEKTGGDNATLTVMLKLDFEEKGELLVFPTTGSIAKLKDFQAHMEGKYAVGSLSSWSGTRASGGTGALSGFGDSMSSFGRGMSSFDGGMSSLSGGGMGLFGGGMSSLGGGMSSYSGASSFGGFAGGMSSFGSGIGTPDMHGMVGHDTAKPQPLPPIPMRQPPDTGPGCDSYNSEDPLTVVAHLSSNFFDQWLKVESLMDGGSQSDLDESIATNQMTVEKAAKRLSIMKDGSESDKAWKSVKKAVEVAIKAPDSSSATALWKEVNTCFKLLIEEIKKYGLCDCINIAIFLYTNMAVMSMMNSGEEVNSEMLQGFVDMAPELPRRRINSDYRDYVAESNKLVNKAITDGSLTEDEATQLVDRLCWQVDHFLAHFKSLTVPPPDSYFSRCSTLHTRLVDGAAAARVQPKRTSAAAKTDAPTTKANTPVVTLSPTLIGAGRPMSEILVALNIKTTTGKAETTTLTTTSSRMGVMSDGYTRSSGTSASATTTEKADEEDTKEPDEKDRESEKEKKSVQTVVEVAKSAKHSSPRVWQQPADHTGSSGSHRVQVELQDHSIKESTEQRRIPRKEIHLPEEGEEMTAEKYSEILDCLPLQEAAELVRNVSDNLKQQWLEDIREISDLLANTEGISTNMQKRLEVRKAKLQEELETIAENKQHANDFLDFHAGRTKTWPTSPLRRQLNEEEPKEGAMALQKVDPEVLHDIMKQVTNPSGQDIGTSEQADKLIQSWYILLPEFSDAAIQSLALDLGIETEGKDRSGILAAITEEWSSQGFDATAVVTYPHIQQLQTPSQLSSEDNVTEAVASGEQTVHIKSQQGSGEKENISKNDEKEEDESEKNSSTDV